MTFDAVSTVLDMSLVLERATIRRYTEIVHSAKYYGNFERTISILKTAFYGQLQFHFRFEDLICDRSGGMSTPGSKLWSSPFNISNSTHSTESSSVYSRTLHTVTNSFTLRACNKQIQSDETYSSKIKQMLHPTDYIIDCLIDTAYATMILWPGLHNWKNTGIRVRSRTASEIAARRVKLLVTVRKIECRTFKSY
uniref:Uncharacterized protein n=1 Tax=Hyaloperonospora arabidopsidis (strain Emoy2) TaxID=559515 RepID=M4BX12_HYAAE